MYHHFQVTFIQAIQQHRLTRQKKTKDKYWASLQHQIPTKRNKLGGQIVGWSRLPMSLPFDQTSGW